MRIVVAGDIIIDQYTYGSVDRIAPDFTGFVFSKRRHSDWFLGGAGNVAKNIQGLCPNDEVHLVGSMDEEHDYLLNTIRLHRVENLSSIKERLIATGDDLPHKPRQKTKLIRIDTEPIFLESITTELLDSTEPDVLIISDYDKGIIDDIPYDMNLPPVEYLFIDSKHLDKFDLSRISERVGETFVKVNNYELMYGEDTRLFDDVTYIITKGSQPVRIWKNKKEIATIPTYPIDTADLFNVDYSGAGDSFLAGLVFAILEGSSITRAVRIANVYAGLNIIKYGITSVSKNTLVEALSHSEEYWQND